jgi:hypothetical protein
MKEITISQIVESVILDKIMEKYDEGDDTHYLIIDDQYELRGTPKINNAVLIPYDGPFTSTVQVDDEGEYFVEIPKRLLSKVGIKDEVEIIEENGSIILKAINTNDDEHSNNR